jgi:Flp pilus assembly protein TadG
VRVLADDRGAVTVEAALALCSLVAVMVMVLAAVSAASANLRCLDAAREAARLVSRGESQRAREIAADIAPRGATVDVQVAGDEVDVRVTTLAVPGVPGLSLQGVAVAIMEPAAFLSTEAPPDPEHDPAADSPGPP